ncbi:MAG: histone deacetylase [Candidatus Lokiarchaeota archaeon]|nr:histone deacetylase [Candidatus Lokiarchaeota archaeon]
MKKKIGILTDDDFSNQHQPPYPRPTFFAYESPLRISSIMSYLNTLDIFNNECIIKLSPKLIDESILKLAHSQYHIDLIKRLSESGHGILGEDIFITQDSYSLAKKAVGGAIEAVESVIDRKVDQSFALIRPPGHHAVKDNASGLCIFNNIANSILYLREKKKYKKKIAIIDIDDHFGDGIARYFYDDPDVLYFSIHEFDFLEGDLGYYTELGEGDGLGKNINFPIPVNTTDKDFLEFMKILKPIFTEFNPDLIICAIGFDMHFADQIGNCLLTSKSYYRFTRQILELSEEICDGKLAFILEGGYNLIALPICVNAVIRSLLNEEFSLSKFEDNKYFLKFDNKRKITKIKNDLKDLLKKYWDCLE